MSALDRIAGALERLDARRHVTPARLELSATATAYSAGWVAQIMADPLTVPVAERGDSPADALVKLAEALERLDWRKVKR